MKKLDIDLIISVKGTRRYMWGSYIPSHLYVSIHSENMLCRIPEVLNEKIK